jgi:hypothetical protein
MKTLIFGLLFTGGILMAQQPQEQPQAPSHVSYFDRFALRSQAPAVPTGKRQTKHPNYRVTVNKSTIVAMVPWGK